MLIRKIMERLNMIKMMIFWEPELYNAGTSALWFTWSTCCCDLMRQQCKTAHFAKHRSLLLKKNKKSEKMKTWDRESGKCKGERERELWMNWGSMSHPPTAMALLKHTDEEIGHCRRGKLRMTSEWCCWLSSSYNTTGKQTHIQTSTTLTQRF